LLLNYLSDTNAPKLGFEKVRLRKLNVEISLARLPLTRLQLLASALRFAVPRRCPQRRVRPSAGDT
jgi:hypothetical protein